MKKKFSIATPIGWSNQLLGVVSGGVIFALVGVVVYGVVMRYVFRSPTASSIELPELLFIAIVAFGLGYTQIHKKHVRVELLVSRLPGKLQNAFNILACVVPVGYFAIVVWALWQKFMVYLALSEVARESRIPFAPFAFAIVIGISLLGLQVISDTVVSVTKGTKGNRQGKD